jgi:hypothetical protein
MTKPFRLLSLLLLLLPLAAVAQYTSVSGVIRDAGDSPYWNVSDASLTLGTGSFGRNTISPANLAVSPKAPPYNAVANCVADDTLAIQATINTGKLVDFGDGTNCYKVTSTITYFGKVRLIASGATIKSDVMTFKFMDATGSRVSGINFLPVTTPYTVLRNPANWSAPITPSQSLVGYQPTVQDPEYKTWVSFLPSIETQGTNIHPGLYFTVSSPQGASDVEISGITGSVTTLILEGYTNSRIHDNNFGGANFVTGGIVLVNGTPVGILQQSFGFTPPRGVNNRVYNNTVKYASYSGIVVYGQDKFAWIGNDSSLNGESGYKTYAYDGTLGAASAGSAVISTTGSIVGNRSYGNYYDGFDLSSFYAVPFAYYYAGTTVTDNISEFNRTTGFTSDGASMAYTANHAKSNGTFGMNVIGANTTTINNDAIGDCTRSTGTPQCFEIVVEGDDAISIGNNVITNSTPSAYNYFHAGVNRGGPPTSGHAGIDLENYSSNGFSKVYIDSTISSSRRFNAPGPRLHHP